MNDIKFGFCVPIFANPGMLSFRTPAYEKLDWYSIKDTVLLCEELGFDSMFVADHLFLGRDGDIWECISLMSALAAITKRMQIIPIHLCNSFRHPGMVAKSLATMSHISNGRIALFYDYGWRKAEFDAYGLDFGKDDEERIEKMSEGLSIIKGLLEEEKFSFKGKHYQLNEAICNPKPSSKVPVWMGEANNPLMVSNIVKHADVFNSMPCSDGSFQDKLDIISEECKRQGRDFSEMRLSLETQVLVRPTEKDAERELDRMAGMLERNNSHDDDILEQLKATNPRMTDYNSRETLYEEFMIGSPEMVKQKIDLFVEKGVDHFMLWFMDYPNTEGIRSFAEDIMPHYR
ncbi:MAG: LLM class flavin-dependent oxidoreductase [Candidatus Omnitrophica bacterium]|nr:LLM class flavin-dependent oxidoreductase [Candidatus Omnitrophota bacterium]